MNEMKVTNFSIKTRKEVVERLGSDFDYYGAKYIAAAYCGFKKPPFTRRRLVWQHGWIPAFFNIHPYIVGFAQDCHKKENFYCVARGEQKIYLRSHGYENTHAIGIPITYIEKKTLLRRPNSLLVMPVHSLYCTTHEHWNFQNYADTVNGLKSQFDEIVVCVHPSCIEKNYWVKEFEAYGFNVIEGADIYDKNSLYRLQEILSSFEYVTTNGFGSHIAYAAYFGAKVSIYGNFTEYKKEDFAADPFYQAYPEILDDTVFLLSESTIRKGYGDFFVSPKEAKQKTEWAKQELGEDNKVSPERFRELLGWDAMSLVKNNTYRVCRNIYRASKKLSRKLLQKT